MEPTKATEEKEIVYDIERMALLGEVKKANNGPEIIFDNDGHMIINNRKYQRDMKRAWRAVQEGKKSVHFYTKAGKKTNKKTKKAERQNRRKGRK